MKPPGLASIAPAPTIAIARDEATSPMRCTMASVRRESGGRRKARTTKPMISAAATTSTIATQVFGVDGCEDAAASPRTNAARTPTASVALKAPA